VPFYVFEDTWAVSGAQPAEVFESALREVAAQA
jgi:predicted DsbA family dithiol-disulfide isomerase